MPDTSLVHDPNRSGFYHHDDRRSSAEAFDPPTTGAVMFRAATAVSLEPQHGPIVARTAIPAQIGQGVRSR
jgi:hypothetical protein